MVTRSHCFWAYGEVETWFNRTDGGVCFSTVVKTEKFSHFRYFPVGSRGSSSLNRSPGRVRPSPLPGNHQSALCLWIGLF